LPLHLTKIAIKNYPLHSKRILVAPLDWGLGHTTRCIPIVKALLEAGCTVTLAAEKETAALLKNEFPQLEILFLKGYRIRYPRKGLFFMPKMFLQLPKVLRAIKYEHAWLKVQQSVMQGKWDLVISDNRYGLYNEDLNTVIITHQLGIITGMGRYFDNLMVKYTHRWLKAFQQVWVPDFSGDNSLAGILSKPEVMPPSVRYIGPLSRLIPDEQSPEHVLIMLSGPEPQRSILERKLIIQATQLKYPVLFVRGLPCSKKSLNNEKNIIFVNHLNSVELSSAIAMAHYVICRSGYSSIMDLIRMRKKALLIPTPGQTEQLYLAEHLKNKGWFAVVSQRNLDLKLADQLISEAHTPLPVMEIDGFMKALNELGIQ
jgi:UDP:flavonoid glycosyltransferase YjiC (YdhE family)